MHNKYIYNLYKIFIYQFEVKMAERGKLLHPEIWTLNWVNWGQKIKWWKWVERVNWGQISKDQIKISTIEITKNPTKTAIIFFPGLLILIFSGISSIKTRKINVPAATQLSEPKIIL